MDEDPEGEDDPAQSGLDLMQSHQSIPKNMTAMSRKAKSRRRRERRWALLVRL